MATSWAARLVSANTRDGVDTRKQENCKGLRTRPGDNLSVEKITGLGCPTTNWGDMMTNMYNNRSMLGVPQREHNPVALYADMADEPWKYGDDIFGWLEMDEQFRAGPERVAVDSYWTGVTARKQDDQRHEERRQRALRDRFTPIAKQAAALAMKQWIDRDIKRFVARIRNSAVRIQAVVRGYQTRCHNPHLDCCMCLSHRIAAHSTAVGFVCRECASLGPHQDIVEGDPWNWHRC